MCGYFAFYAMALSIEEFESNPPRPPGDDFLWK